MLELTDAITATPATVSQDLRQRLQKRFSTPQLVELGAAIAWENYRSRSNRVFGFQSEGFYQAGSSGTPVKSATDQQPTAKDFAETRN